MLMLLCGACFGAVSHWLCKVWQVCHFTMPVLSSFASVPVGVVYVDGGVVEGIAFAAQNAAVVFCNCCLVWLEALLVLPWGPKPAPTPMKCPLVA